MSRHTFTGKMIVALLAITVAFIVPGCGGGGSKSTPEATLTVTTTPAVNTTQAPAPAAGPFNLNVNITSAMPAKGVTILVTAAPDGTPTNFFSTSVSTTKASNDFVITGTPLAEVCLVTITVTSNSTSSNTWTGTYRYSGK